MDGNKLVPAMKTPLGSSKARGAFSELARMINFQPSLTPTAILSKHIHQDNGKFRKKERDDGILTGKNAV